MELLDLKVIEELESSANWVGTRGAAALVTFTTLSVGGFIAVGIYAPSALGITAVGIATLAQYVFVRVN